MVSLRDFRFDFTHVAICFLYSGSHTGARIFDRYEESLTHYGLSDKVSYVITDNAANMKSAFKASFPTGDGTSEMTLDDIDEEMTWVDNTDTSVEIIETERLACFAHTLQHTVMDGLKEVKPLGAAISQCTAVSNHLHRSTSFKVGFAPVQHLLHK